MASKLVRTLNQMVPEKSRTDKNLMVAVIGGAQCSTEEAALAEEVGRKLAKRGAILVCGGLTGIMESACRGAVANGGLTVGLLPSDDPTTANPYVQIPIATGVGYARNIAVVKSSQAIIAIDGDYGTLTEIAFALKSAIPIIGLNTWSLSRNGKEEKSIIKAKNAVDAVEKAISLARGAKVH